MRFISKEAVNNKKLILSNAENFDPGLVTRIEKEDKSIYAMEYKTKGIGNPIGAPFIFDSLFFYALITAQNIYVSAVGEFANDEDYELYEGYTVDGFVEFDVDLSASEKIALLSCLLRGTK